MQDADSLYVQFADDFHGRDLNLDCWTQLRDIYLEDGCACLRALTDEPDQPAGPGVMAYCKMSTVKRHFNPGLVGTNLFEVSLVDVVHDDDFINKYMTVDGGACDHEDPLSGNYLMGFALAIGTYPVPLSGNEVDRTNDRTIQVHFDLYGNIGLFFSLCRNIIPGDEQKYRFFDRKTDGPLLREGKALPCPNMTIPGNSVTLAMQHNPLGANSVPWGHRYGLQLSEDANVLSWMLDGKIMDTVDITGFFASSPGCAAKGLYATICGGSSYRTNCFKIADAQIRVSR